MITGKGTNIALAMRSIAMDQGKIIGLAHANVIVISDSVGDINVMEVLDFFMRDRSFSNAALLISTPDSAKELLEVSLQQGGTSLSALKDYITFNDVYLFGTDSTILSFVNNYFSPAHASVVTRLKTEELEPSGDSGGGGGSSGGAGLSEDGEGSDGGGSKAPSIDKKTRNDGDMAVYKRGKLVKALNLKEYRGYNWVKDYAPLSLVEVENVNDDTFSDASVMLKILKKGVKKQFDFDSATGYPVLKCAIDIKVTVVNIVQEKNVDNFYEGHESYLTDTVKDGLKDLVRNEIANSLSIAKAHSYDIYNIAQSYNKFRHCEWKEYLDRLDDVDNYMEQLEIFCDVNIAAEVQ